MNLDEHRFGGKVEKEKEIYFEDSDIKKLKITHKEKVIRKESGYRETVPEEIEIEIIKDGETKVITYNLLKNNFRFEKRTMKD